MNQQFQVPTRISRLRLSGESDHQRGALGDSARHSGVADSRGPFKSICDSDAVCRGIVNTGCNPDLNFQPARHPAASLARLAAPLH